MKKIISVLLVLLLLTSTMLLSSCGVYSTFPKGYTGGVGLQSELSMEPYCLETYEEVVDAIEQLKSHGSTFQKSGIVSCEIEGVDIKYSITLFTERGDAIRYGENPYDRCVDNVKITSYIFLEDATVEEISYSFFAEYNCYMLSLKSDKYDNIDLESAKIEYEKNDNDYSVTCGDEYSFSLYSQNENAGELSLKQIESIIRSVEFVGFE